MDLQSCDFHLNISAHLSFYDLEGPHERPFVATLVQISHALSTACLCAITSPKRGGGVQGLRVSIAS